MWRNVIRAFLFGCMCATGVSAFAQGDTYVGGEAVYLDTETKLELPAPGAQLKLASGAVSPDQGVAGARILDSDSSASPLSGDPPASIGTFVLIGAGQHPRVTILYYPWPTDGRDPSLSPGMLSKVISASTSGRGNLLRAKVRVRLTPTDATLSDVRAISSAIRTAYVARDLAVLSDVRNDVVERNLGAELERISAMIPDEGRGKLVDAVLEVVKGDELISSKGGASLIKETLTLSPERLNAVRQNQNEFWRFWRSLEPRQRSFEKIGAPN